MFQPDHTMSPFNNPYRDIFLKQVCGVNGPSLLISTSDCRDMSPDLKVKPHSNPCIRQWDSGNLLLSLFDYICLIEQLFFANECRRTRVIGFLFAA